MKQSKAKVLVRKKKSGKKGFTLIELLAVIVILALLLLLVSPKIMSILDQSKKQTCINNMKQIEKVIDLDIISKGRDIPRNYAFNPKEGIKDKLTEEKLKYSGKLLVKGNLEYFGDGETKIDDVKCRKWEIKQNDQGSM